MHGDCEFNPAEFPGKGKEHVQDVSFDSETAGQDVYQTGILPDGAHSVLLYYVAVVLLVKGATADGLWSWKEANIFSKV